MRKSMQVVVLAALVVMMLVVGVSGAFAGEKAGPPGPGGAEGKWTPINDWRAASACSFSGLNDAIPGDGPFPEFTQTQSYGTFLVEFGKDFLDAATGGPGIACNPTRGEG